MSLQLQFMQVLCKRTKWNCVPHLIPHGLWLDCGDLGRFIPFSIPSCPHHPSQTHCCSFCIHPPDGTTEQYRILEDNGESGTESVKRQFADVYSVNHYPPCLKQWAEGIWGNCTIRKIKQILWLGSRWWDSMPLHSLSVVTQTWRRWMHVETQPIGNPAFGWHCCLSIFLSPLKFL